MDVVPLGYVPNVSLAVACFGARSALERVAVRSEDVLAWHVSCPRACAHTHGLLVLYVWSDTFGGEGLLSLLRNLNLTSRKRGIKFVADRGNERFT